jgi:hypothetical protein
MSISKHIYLGPYIECTYKPATRTTYVNGCTNVSCERHTKRPPAYMSTRFCPACGAPIGKIPVEVPDRPDCYDVVGDELLNMSSRTDVLRLAPNVHRSGDPRPSWQLDGDEEFCLDLQQVNPRAEMVWLERAFAPEISKLREAYATVEIKWGVCQYFM